MRKFKNWLRNKLRTWLQVDICEQNLDLLIQTTNRNYDKITTEFSNINNKTNLLIENINNIENSMKTHKQYINDSVKENEIAIRKIYNTVENIVHIGTDVYREPSYGRSWAVICIEGKMKFVKFIDLGRSEARDVMMFLKQFEVGKHCIDSPYKEMFYEGLFKL